MAAIHARGIDEKLLQDIQSIKNEIVFRRNPDYTQNDFLLDAMKRNVEYWKKKLNR